MLIIREIWIRNGMGLLHLFVMGFTYGIYNEGLFARTIFSPFHSPAPSYALFGLIEGVRVPWLLAISGWHALFAVIFPIIIVHYLFPAKAEKPWLNLKFAWLFGLFGIVTGVLGFLSTNGFPEPGGMAHLWFMALCGAVATLLLFILPKSPRISPEGRTSFSFKAPLWGLTLFFLLYIVPFILSLLASSTVFIGYFLAALLCIGFLVYRKKEVSLTALAACAFGGYIALTLFSLSYLWMVPIHLATSAFFLLIFTTGLLKLRKSAHSR